MNLGCREGIYPEQIIFFRPIRKNYVHDTAKLPYKYVVLVYLAESIHSPERQVNSSSGLQQSLSSSPPAHSRSPSQRPAHLPNSGAKKIY